MMRPISALCLCVTLAAPAYAQTPCEDLEERLEGETLQQFAERCNTSLEGLLDANNADSLADLRSRDQLIVPQAGSDANWLERARQSVVDAGERIGDAATAAGRSASDYLKDQPELNQDIVRFGEQLGLPGFEAGPAVGAQLEVRPQEGTRLNVMARGLPGDSDVRLGWIEDGVFRPLQILTTGPRGEVDITVERPQTLPMGRTVTFALQTEDEKLRLATDPVALE